MLTWLENNYIGKREPNSSIARVVPRFHIEEWNLHDRIKQALPTTINLVEVWYGLEAKKHLTCNKTVELLRKEQSNMEASFLIATMGEIIVIYNILMGIFYGIVIPCLDRFYILIDRLFFAG